MLGEPEAATAEKAAALRCGTTPAVLLLQIELLLFSDDVAAVEVWYRVGDCCCCAPAAATAAPRRGLVDPGTALRTTVNMPQVSLLLLG